MISVSSRERAFHFTQHPLSSGSQRRQIVLYGVPQHLIVHAVITVADLVPHAGDQAPRDLRITLLEFFRQAFEPDVYVLDIEANGTRLSAPRRLTLDERADYPYSWTPDSKAVIFTSDRNGT